MLRLWWTIVFLPVVSPLSYNSEISLRTLNFIENSLAEATFPTRQIAKGFEIGLLGPDPDEFILRQFLYSLQATVSSKIQNLYAGFEDGLFVGYTLTTSGDWEYVCVNGTTDTCDSLPCLHHYDFGSSLILSPSGDGETFDYTSTSWYRNGIQTDTTWTAVSVSEIDGSLSMACTSSIKVNDVAIGVMATNIELEHITTFLQEEFQHDEDVVFLFDTAGHLIATSENTPHVQTDGQVVTTINVTDVSTFLIRDTYEFLLEHGQSDDFVYIHNSRLIQRNTLVLSDQVNITIVVISPIDPPLSYVPIGSESMKVMVAMGLVGCITSVCLGIWVIRYRKMYLWKMAQPPVLVLLTIATLMCSATPFVLIGENTKVLCGIRPWWITISVTFVCAALLGKVERVYVVASAKKFERKVRGTWSVILKVVALVFVQVVIQILWISIDPQAPKTSFVTISGNVIYERTKCSSEHQWGFGLSVAWIAILMLVGCVLSYLTRSYSELFAESRSLMFTIYHGSLIAVILLILISVQVSSMSSQMLLTSLGMVWFTLVTQMTLFLPRLFRQLSQGDLSINEVHEKTTKQDAPRSSSAQS